MGGSVTRFFDAVTRKKTINTPTPGLPKRLTMVDLVTVGMSSIVGLGGYVCVGAGSAEWAGPSITLSVLLTAASTIITGFVCAELHVRIPKGGGVYAHVYTTVGELPAVMVASSLLLDLLLLSAFAARSSSQYMEASINRSLSDLLHPRLTFAHDSRYFSPNYDLSAASVVAISTLMAVAGTKVICQIGGVAVGVSLLVLSAISCTAFVRADLRHWTQQPGFFPHSFCGVMSGGAFLSIGVVGSHTASLLMDECTHSKLTLSRLGMGFGTMFLLTLFPSALAFTLASSSFETAAPLGNLFPGPSLTAMRTLVGLGGILGLWATTVSGIFGASRLLHRLSCDGLAPRWFRVVSPVTATPWVSVLFCGILSATTSTLCSSWLLLRVIGTGTLSSGMASAIAVLSCRYGPQSLHSATTTHMNPATSITPHSNNPDETTNLNSTNQKSYETFDESQPRQLSVEWESGNWVTTVVEPPQPPTWITWKTSRFLITTFVINCLVGVVVVRGAKEMHIGNWLWAGVALCVGGCLVCGFGLCLQPKDPPPPDSKDQRDMVPIIPLIAIFTNILLMLNLPLPALTISSLIWATGCLVWVVRGRTRSLEAVLSKALLTQNDPDAPTDVL